jgi:peptidyl-prolyl cis-trans isomerase SurA
MKTLVFLLLLLPALGQAQVKAMDETSRAAAKEKLEGIRLRVIKGESMATLAEQYSEDPGSAKNGGLYVNMQRGVLVPEFEAVAFSLKPGQISDVFETQYGFHFIQLVSSHDGMVDLRHILVVPR